MNCYEFKGGTGTASRVVAHDGTSYSVGVLVQANFGARSELRIAGLSLGELFVDDNPMAEHFSPSGAGSVIAIVATDAPLLPNQCEALARRVTLGLARTGTAGSHFSGDLFLAVSTGNPGAFTPGALTLFGKGRPYDDLRFVAWGWLDPFYRAVVQATEEAALDALVANEEMVGFRGHRTPGFPRERLVEILQARGIVKT
jgi:L-aminopeptidase/D-esterase-like protein